MNKDSRLEQIVESDEEQFKKLVGIGQVIDSDSGKAVGHESKKALPEVTDRDNDVVIWLCQPSQWLAFKWYVIGILSLVVSGVSMALSLWHYNGEPESVFPWVYGLPPVVFVFVWYWKTLVLKSQQYWLTSSRLKVATGVLNKKFNQVEVFRINDFQEVSPILLRIVGLSNIIIYSARDATNPEMVIPGVRGARYKIEKLRSVVEEAKRRNGVVQFN